MSFINLFLLNNITKNKLLIGLSIYLAILC